MLRHEWSGRVVSLVHFGTGRAVDVVDINANYVSTGAGVFRSGRQGVEFAVDNNTASYIESSGALPGVSGGVTLCFFLPFIGGTDFNGSMLYAIPASSNYTQLNNAGDGIFILGSGGTYSLGENVRSTYDRSLILRAAGADPAIFVDRAKRSGATGSIPAGGKTIRLGAWSGSSYQFIGSMGSVAVVSGELSDSEAVGLATYPWMFYASDPVRFYSLPSGPITLNSLTMSAFTSSGARATLGITR